MKNLQKLFALALISLWISCSSSSSNSPVNSGNCSTECSYTIASNETAGTTAASLDGTYNLTFHHPQANAPFTEGTKATFTISNNVLTVEIEGQECITIKNPVLTVAGSTEVKFKDSCRDNLSYDVSENNGSLNEVNLSDINGNWLGQFNDR